MKQIQEPWTYSTTQALADLSSSGQGLSSRTAQERLANYGPNQLQAGKRAGPLGIFLGQFADVLVGILLLAAGVSAVMGAGRWSLGTSCSWRPGTRCAPTGGCWNPPA